MRNKIKMSVLLANQKIKLQTSFPKQKKINAIQSSKTYEILTKFRS